MNNNSDNRRPEDNVKTASRPSDLRIIDVRTCTVGWHGWRFPLVRIDTNQGIYGIGEVRDGATKNYALMLKRQLIGENPCNLDKVFRKIKQFGGHARQGGGVCGIEMALMDVAGKAYNVPAYMLAGGKFRDKVRMYCDTPNEPTGEAMGHKLLDRLAKGFTMLKMDIGIEMLRDEPGTLTWPAGMLGETPMNSSEFDKIVDRSQIMHPFTHVHITPKGLKMLADYVADVRAVIGYDVPLAVDHFGHIGVDDCLKLGDVLDAAVGSGATNLHGLRFDVKRCEALEREALQIAVANAMGHAGRRRRARDSGTGQVNGVAEVASALRRTVSVRMRTRRVGDGNFHHYSEQQRVDLVAPTRDRRNELERRALERRQDRRIRGLSRHRHGGRRGRCGQQRS